MAVGGFVLAYFYLTEPKSNEEPEKGGDDLESSESSGLVDDEKEKVRSKGGMLYERLKR